MATVSLTIRIDEHDKKAVEQLAKKDDRSISYVVNQAIKEFIKKNLPDKEEWGNKKCLLHAPGYAILNIRKKGKAIEAALPQHMIFTYLYNLRCIGKPSLLQ